MKCGYWRDNEIRAYLGVCVCRRYTPRPLNMKRAGKAILVDWTVKVESG